METLNRQTSLFIEEPSTFSQEDSHANLIPWQARGLAKMTRDTFFQKCYEPLMKSSQHGSWAKMFVVLLAGTMGWYSRRRKLTWKHKVTKSNRSYFLLQVSTRPISETDSGLLHTPTATGNQGAPTMINRDKGSWGNLLLTPTTKEEPVNLEVFRKRMEKYPNGTTMPNLATQVSEMILKTPTAADSYTENLSKKEQKFGNSGTLAQEVATGFVEKRGLMLPTPKVSDTEGAAVKNVQTSETGYFRENAKGERWGVKLRDVAESNLIPTPTARCHNAGTTKERPQGQPTRRSELNHLMAQEAGKTSQLNPLFVEEMMGFPENWTLSPFLNGEKNPSKDMETQ